MTEIFLFCQHFPNRSGEQFLFNEVKYYPPNVKVNVFIENTKNNQLELSNNFIINRLNFEDKPSVKLIVKNYWKIILKTIIFEIFNSPHGYKYIRDFKVHLFLLIGYLQKAIILQKTLPVNRRIRLYSYWFDEWATIIHLVKKISHEPIEVICRAHAYDFDEAQVVSGYHLFRAFDLKGFDKVISVSEYGKRYIERKYKFSKVKVHKIGVRNNGDNPFKINFEKTIVSCSTLIPLKRVYLIIEILKHINCEVRWIHFGNGPLEKNFLQDAAILPVNIKFEYKGQVPNNEILSFYQNNSVDFFINVSELEGIPVSLMEAISFGIPVIGCDICGVPEIVNEQTGLLLEKEFNIEQTALLIENFLLTKCIDIKFRKLVKVFWKDNFDADKVYPEFINKYLLAK